MIRFAAALALALTAGPALAQTVSPPPARVPDLSAYQTKAEATSAASTIQAQVPAPCGAVPGADTLLGTVGSATCYVPRDATRPTSVQGANVVTDASGTWSVTWARPFASSAPVVNPLPVNTGSLPILCNVTGRTGSYATGRCWQATTMTLPGVATALLGLVLNPFGTAAASAPVMVIAREPTQ